MSRSRALRVDPKACVDPSARLGPGVFVGPFARLGAGVRVGAGTRIEGGAVVVGASRIGRDCWIFPGAVVGGPPQDLKYRGEPTLLEIGDATVIRECATIHRGTPEGGGVTRVGRRCLVMAGAHIAHDCQVGDFVVMDNAVLLGGHVRIGDMAVIGGGTAVHQFTTIGRAAFVGGMSRVSRDVPPFLLVEGHPAEVRAVNERGMRRHGFSGTAIEAVEKAFRVLYRSELSVTNAIREILAARPRPEVRELVESLRAAETGRYGRADEARRRDPRDPPDPRRRARPWWAEMEPQA
ncbi:MAG: acyl-ACP--UDP-N-acetylglucosamine O-acyltransferase [Planctomycetota bacterium]